MIHIADPTLFVIVNLLFLMMIALLMDLYQD